MPSAGGHPYRCWIFGEANDLLAIMSSDWLGTDSEKWFDIALDSVLGEARADVIARERTAFDRLCAGRESSLVLFGAGALGRTTLRGLRAAGVEPIAFADNNASLWGTQVQGLTVYSANDAVERFGTRSAFVITVYNGSRVRRQLRDLACETVVPFTALYWKYPDSFVPNSGIDLPHRIQEQVDDIRAGYHTLADDVSRREFCAQIRWRFEMDDTHLAPPDDPNTTYFPSDIVTHIDDEVLVDCGAYDGDSIRAFFRNRGDRFRRIYALEPDPDNRQTLHRFLASLPGAVSARISVLPYAAGERTGYIAFAATGTEVSSMVPGLASHQIECRPLDELCGHEAPSYIKMDIEAAEPAALQGASRILQRHSPVVAACVYHRCEHLWQIPRQLARASSEYSIFLRRYAEESWETVCYAVPLSRLAALA